MSALPAGWELVVGLEVHVQLLTRTKIFCDCATAFGAPPNRHTCPVCLGMPGALPVLNGEAVALAARAALALGATVHPVSVFARKHYFYPDLPKGYQITQFDRPLATGGALPLGDGREGVPLVRLHLEEDAGKSLHDRFAGASAIDLNRAGTPLIEIVTEPAIHDPEVAGEALRTLRQVLAYADVSDVSMEEGSLRVDANVSVRRVGEAGLRPKCEIKNLNSFSAVERAIAAEARRQVAVYADGGTVSSQTMLWDERRDGVRPARSKEESHDYRYFPDPDLPPLVLTDGQVAAWQDALPELPTARRARYVASFAIPAADAAVLCADRAVADYFEAAVPRPEAARATANWVLGEVLAWCKADGATIARFPVAPARLGELVTMVADGTVSGSAGKTILARMIATGDAPAVIADREGLRQVGDDASLAGWIDAVLAAHPDEAARFLAGERKLQGVLVGFVMKASGGTADPRRVNQLLAARAGG